MQRDMAGALRASASIYSSATQIYSCFTLTLLHRFFRIGLVIFPRGGKKDLQEEGWWNELQPLCCKWRLMIYFLSHLF